MQDFAKYLVFEAGGEKLAIEVLRVREITGQSPVSRVPGAAAFVRGVTNLRGKVIPVVDLALRLGLPPRPSTPRTALVICEASLAGERLVVALLVDGVDDVAELPPEAILPPPSLGSTRVDVFSGLARRAADLFLILDPDRILDGTTQARMSSGA